MILDLLLRELLQRSRDWLRPILERYDGSSDIVREGNASVSDIGLAIIRNAYDRIVRMD